MLLFDDSGGSSFVFFFILSFILYLILLELFRIELLLGSRLFYFDLLFGIKVFIFCCPDVTMISLKTTWLQIIFDLFLLVRIDLWRHLFNSSTCAYAYTHLELIIWWKYSIKWKIIITKYHNTHIHIIESIIGEVKHHQTFINLCFHLYKRWK